MTAYLDNGMTGPRCAARLWADTEAELEAWRAFLGARPPIGRLVLSLTLEQTHLATAAGIPSLSWARFRAIREVHRLSGVVAPPDQAVAWHGVLR